MSAINFVATTIIVFLSIGLQAQEYYSVKFVPTYRGSELELNKNYYHEGVGDSVLVSKLKCYFSGIKITTASQDLLIKDYYLFDQEQNRLLTTQVLTDVAVTKISFTVGVDSLTNMSGAQGQDLDPIHGMYWAWQSGYINFKLEGISIACPTRKNKFQYHIGGFLDPYNSERRVSLEVSESDPIIKIYFSIDGFFDEVNLAEEHTIMSPGLASMRLADNLAQLFKVIDEQ